MSEFSARGWVTISVILVFSALAIFVNPYWFGGLIFPAVIWADVWAQKKKNNG